MHAFFEKMKTIHGPNETEPWLELGYTDYSNFRQFVEFIDSFDNLVRLRQHRQPFFFRGQSNAEWTLKPKLFRFLEGVPLEDALGYEYESVCYFRERAHLFCSSLVPTDGDFLEWISLMQHFSAPTRMLDWTSSFTVALYFAICDEPMDVPGAVWLVQSEPLWDWMNENLRDSEWLNDDLRKRIVCGSDDFVEFGVKRASRRLHGYDPDRKSERVTAQRGVFTICEQLFVDHASIIGEALLEGAKAKKNLPLCKIVISREAKRFFRTYLNKLNITAGTLFPGTDGLGRTITETMVVYREMFHST